MVISSFIFPEFCTNLVTLSLIENYRHLHVVSYVAYLVIGCIIRNLGLGLLQRISMCKLIPEVTSYGLIVLVATNVPGKVISVYVPRLHFYQFSFLKMKFACD